jgi:hypothetical protein
LKLVHQGATVGTILLTIVTDNSSAQTLRNPMQLGQDLLVDRTTGDTPI